MIAFVLGLAVLYGVLCFIFQGYELELAIIVVSIEVVFIGFYLMIKRETDNIIRKHRNILREELINDIEKLYKCKNLNDVIDWRLDR